MSFLSLLPILLHGPLVHQAAASPASPPGHAFVPHRRIRRNPLEKHLVLNGSLVLAWPLGTVVSSTVVGCGTALQQCRRQSGWFSRFPATCSCDRLKYRTIATFDPGEPIPSPPPDVSTEVDMWPRQHIHRLPHP